MHAAETIAKAMSMDRLYPIRGKNDAIKNETIAMGMSLNNSNVLACNSSTPYTFCDFKITIPTLLSRMAKTK